MSREKLSDSPLKKVVWQAVIDGPLMSYTSSQQYHNDRKDPVEINYSFPSAALWKECYFKVQGQHQWCGS